MIGNGYWSTGIIVRYGYSGEDRYGWAAEVKFFDSGFCNDDTDRAAVSTEGMLHTRYFVLEGTGPDADGLATAIDAVKADAERLGIRFHNDGAAASCVYYQGDGEHKDWPPPAGWRELVDAQAVRLGWKPMYTTESGDDA